MARKLAAEWKHVLRSACTCTKEGKVSACNSARAHAHALRLIRRCGGAGGGGQSGSTSLEALMERLRFRGKPCIADLTSARRLADKARAACSGCGVLACSESVPVQWHITP